MTAHVLLLSHAATASARVAGFPLADEPLDPAVEPRLAALRGRARYADRRLVSPLSRAAQTAVALGIDATPDPSLVDCDFGRWRGWSLQEAQDRDPEGVAAWLSDPSSAPHGGESIVALIGRVRVWLSGQSSTRGVTLAVTHPAVVKAAMVAALEVEARAFWRIDVAPLSMVRLSGHAGRWNFSSLEALETGA